MSVAETAARLQAHAVALVQSTLAAGCLACHARPFEATIVLGTHMHADAVLAARVQERLVELGQACELQALRSHGPPPAYKGTGPGASERWQALYESHKADLQDAVVAHLGHTHPIWDGPTVALLEDLHRSLRLQRQQAAQVRTQLVSEGLFQGNAQWDMPARPGRDVRFELVARAAPPPQGLSLKDEVIHDMHFNLMSLEIPTIEHCARLIWRFPTQPWSFVTDMTRQAWDEARHATAVHVRLVELGGRPGVAPIDLHLWELTTDRPLPLALTIHQRLGEWIGVEGALWAIGDLSQRGDPQTARIYEFIAQDEIAHVALGNKWIRRLVSSEEDIQALTRQARLLRTGQVEPGLPLFPFQSAACRRGGFTEAEAEALKSTFSELGSVFE